MIRSEIISSCEEKAGRCSILMNTPDTKNTANGFCRLAQMREFHIGISTSLCYVLITNLNSGAKIDSHEKMRSIANEMENTMMLRHLFASISPSSLSSRLIWSFEHEPMQRLIRFALLVHPANGFFLQYENII